MGSDATHSPTGDASHLLAALRRLRGVASEEASVDRLLGALREETRASRVTLHGDVERARPRGEDAVRIGEDALDAHPREVRASAGELRIVLEGPEVDHDAAEILAMEVLSLLHVRLLEEERKRSRDLALINEIGGVVAKHLDLDTVLDAAVRELARVIGVPRVLINLVDDDRKQLTTVACSQPGHPMLSVPVDGPGTVALAFRTGRPVVIEDAAADDRSMQRFVKTLGTTALFVVPLVASGEPIGTLLLAEDRGVRKFTEEEVARATAVANLISPAIANAKMFADLRRSYDALSRAQSELVTSERLAALGELSAVIAHEVRNPLAIIFNSLGALRRVAATTDDAKALLDIVGEEADRLNRIVADLLDFVRPYASHPRPTNVEALVRGAIEGARRSPAAGDASIEAELGTFEPELLLDATMIQQALINLITNALQVTPPGGRVTVRVHALDGARIRFAVADEGPGIDPADAARIFVPFFTTKPTGTGLGLAVVRRIADALSGTVEVTPGDERGSVFTLTVPS